MVELFDKHGGFWRLHSFTPATIIQMETLRFCRRFLTHDTRAAGAKFYDPKGRQYDQMTQAARSGRQNIIEGSERAGTSKDTEMKLTDVARASLSELRGDYEMVILDRGQVPWSVHTPACPLCGKTMRRRKSAKGEFWGCSGFPECKGTRPMAREGPN
jgi:restriction system protein